MGVAYVDDSILTLDGQICYLDGGSAGGDGPSHQGQRRTSRKRVRDERLKALQALLASREPVEELPPPPRRKALVRKIAEDAGAELPDTYEQLLARMEVEQARLAEEQARIDREIEQDDEEVIILYQSSIAQMVKDWLSRWDARRDQ